jgi:Fic family protein
MAENVKVKPTPIQRNANDVAVELLTLRARIFGIDSPDDIETLFAKYYAIADVCERKGVKDLQKLVSEDILAKIGKFESSSW